MTRQYLFAFSILYACMHFTVILPRWIDEKFHIPIEGITWHELSEFILAPVLISSLFVLYYDLLPKKDGKIQSLWQLIPFLVLSTIASYGQGVHMAGNAIHSLLSIGQEYNPNAGLTLRVVYFLDEYLGHHLLFAPLAILTLILIYLDKQKQTQEQQRTQRQQRQRQQQNFLLRLLSSFLVYFFGFLHGVAWFSSGVEGQTVLTVSLPCSILILGDFLVDVIRRKKAGDVTTYFRVAAIVSFILFVLWGWKFGGKFPEFRVLGLGPFSTWLGQFKEMGMKSLAKFL